VRHFECSLDRSEGALQLSHQGVSTLQATGQSSRDTVTIQPFICASAHYDHVLAPTIHIDVRGTGRHVGDSPNLSRMHPDFLEVPAIAIPIGIVANAADEVNLSSMPHRCDCLVRPFAAELSSSCLSLHGLPGSGQFPDIPDVVDVKAAQYGNPRASSAIE
jgi:hypothetical protein